MKLDQCQKVEVLLHFESTLREDWRFLNKSRVIVGAAFVGGATSILGWVANVDAVSSFERDAGRIGIVALAVLGTLIIGWFGSSLNNLKRHIVRVERALLLFEEDAYLSKATVLGKNSETWGEVWLGWVWGKSVITCGIIGALFFAAVGVV